MDFVADQLFDGRRFKALTVVDNHSRKCLAIHADQSITGEGVVNIMERLKETYEVTPGKYIMVANLYLRCSISRPMIIR